MAINKVCIAGNLTRDAELRTVSGANGDFAVLNFGVAVNQRRKEVATGEWVDDPVFVDCTVFGTRAKRLAQYMGRGQKVFVSGHLRFSTYLKDDERRSKLSVIVEDLEFGGRRQTEGAVEEPPTADCYDEDIPF